MFVRGSSQGVVRFGVKAQGKLHITLPARNPDLANIHIAERVSFRAAMQSQRSVFLRGHGGQCNSEAAGRSFGLRAQRPVPLHRQRAAVFCFTPKLYGDASL